MANDELLYDVFCDLLDEVLGDKTVDVDKLGDKALGRVPVVDEPVVDESFVDELVDLTEMFVIVICWVDINASVRATIVIIFQLIESIFKRFFNVRFIITYSNRKE